jgi:hypothetical protein
MAYEQGYDGCGMRDDDRRERARLSGKRWMKEQLLAHRPHRRTAC